MKIFRGTTSKLLHIFIQDSSQTDGRGLSGLTFNTAGLTCYFLIEGAASTVPISLVTATLGTWVSGGFKEVDATNMPGLYELGAPNLAVASGNSVKIYLRGAANMAATVKEVELDAINYQDGVRAGLTALPNANAGAAGGLPTGDASGHVTLTTTDHTAVQADATAALNAAMPGSPTAGSAFAAIKTNLDTTVSSRSTYAGGAVASVAAGVTLATGEHTAIQADATAALNAAMPGSPTTGSAFAAIKTNLDAAVSTRQSGSAAVTLPTTPPAGYLASDVVTAMKADSQWKLLLSHASGKFVFDPVAGTLELFDTDGTTILKTLTLTVDSSKNVTLRV